MRSLFRAAALVCLSAVAAAQSPPDPAPARAARDSRSASEAAERSRSLPLLGSRRVRYEEVLANPDDVELNHLFAQTQIREGDLRGAAATLERILMIDPSLPRVRLLYGVVLYRLDDLVEAEREFEAVARLEMPRALRREVEGYLEAIRLRQRRTRFALAASVGMQWDSNRAATPDGDSVLVLDTPLPLLAREEDDFAFVSILEAAVEHDLESQAGHRIFAELDYSLQKQGDLEQLDLMGGVFRAGAALETPWLSVVPSAHVGLTSLDLELYRQRYGGGVELRRRFRGRFDLSGLARAEYQDYDAISISRRASERSGARVDAIVGAGAALTPFQRVDLSAGYAEKRAREDFWQYRGFEVGARYTLLLGRGAFVAATGSFGKDWYDEADPVVSARVRRDERWRGRIASGAPLRLLLGGAESLGAVHDVLVSVAGEYYRSDSNLPNFDYDDWKASLLFTKRFQF